MRPAAVGEAAGDRAQQQAGDRVGADHHPDRDVAVAERAVHVARQHRQHRADREQAAEGDREEAGEGEAGPVRPAGAASAWSLTAAARRGRRRRGRAGSAPRRRLAVGAAAGPGSSPARPARPPSMSEEMRSPTIATRARAPPSASSAISKRWRSGLPAISAAPPGGGLDRGQDRAGPGPVAAGHRHRRVVAGADQRRAGGERPASRSAARRSRSRGGRRRRRRRPRARPRPRARSTPAAATISFSVARADHEGAAARPGGLAGEAGGDHAGGDDPALGPTSTPSSRSRSA